jgi:hypothetical protein
MRVDDLRAAAGSVSAVRRASAASLSICGSQNAPVLVAHPAGERLSLRLSGEPRETYEPLPHDEIDDRPNLVEIDVPENQHRKSKGRKLGRPPGEIETMEVSNE